MRPCGEAIRPLVSFFLALAICLVWVVYSKNDILDADVRCFFFMSGTLYANMSCRLIVAQVSISYSFIKTFKLTFALQTDIHGEVKL
jgi:ethanolaminephosphotransferase